MVACPHIELYPEGEQVRKYNNTNLLLLYMSLAENNVVRFLMLYGVHIAQMQLRDHER